MASRSTRRGRSSVESDIKSDGKTYEEIMGLKESDVKGSRTDATKMLSDRLTTFRKWLIDEAKASVHPGICIVNGEATDGTKNAPVLVFEAAPDASKEVTAKGRLGVIDREGDQALYDRTLGCQIRAVREIKKDETIMTIPRGAMITPDLVASSDAGKAILACCKSIPDQNDFWDVFENTRECVNRVSSKIPRNNAPQILVKILQERKKAETMFQKATEENSESFTLAEPGIISTRAPLMAFLIHQRFSDRERPFVSEHDFSAVMDDSDNALKKSTTIDTPPGCAETFAPYARTLPSSVAIPLCWKRNELALLTGCLPGLPVLQDVATNTVQLANEFMALLSAGILDRFPDVFPKGLLTFERWVWAAAVISSRSLPASLYIDDHCDISSFAPVNNKEFQSPAELWNELGVMVPLLDMLNHEVEGNQVTWKPPINSGALMVGSEDLSPEESLVPRAIVHTKVRKGSEIFTCYGLAGNTDLLLQYGFTMMNNPSDTLRMGWGLQDGVGDVPPPPDHPLESNIDTDFVFESSDEEKVNAWWTSNRLKLLQREALAAAGESFVELLKTGKKLTTTAYNDGSYDPVFLTAAVVTTMPASHVEKTLSIQSGARIPISPRHQLILLRYLEFIFSRKLEKLLSNLESGLKGHYAGINLSTKAPSNEMTENQEESSQSDSEVPQSKEVGWQTFFDSHAYTTAIEIEQRFYSMGADSCVLSLYDGHVRTLKTSTKGLSTDNKLSPDLEKQLTDLNFDVITDEDDECDMESTVPKDSKESGNGEAVSKSPRNKKRNRKRGKDKEANAAKDRPPALKLHIGNLSYTTTPSDLYDFFSGLYGEGNVLECHIPTERDSGRSRGFGFVAMPERIAKQVLESNVKHEVCGRAVKIAMSNSVGATNITGRLPASQPPPQQASSNNDRCVKCGYRPRYCTCAPNSIGSDRYASRPGHSADRTPPDYQRPPPDYDRPPRGHDQYGAPHDWHREDRYREGYDRYGDYDRDRGHRSSRSYERGEERRSRRDRDDSRERSLQGRTGSHRWDYEDARGRDRRADDDWDRDRKRSRSRSRSRERERSKKKKSRRSRGRSKSPPSP
jgi:RNA recognition motif-containing protein